MTDSQKQRALEILHSLVEADPAERDRLLEETCAADPDLKKEVERLLALEGEASRFMESVARPSREPEAVKVEPGSIGPLERSPERVGCFRLLDVLGEGGMGVVHLAEQTEPVRRRVALKLIRPGMDTREVVARFEAERQALAVMDHPSVARVYEAGSSEDGRPYFAMEYVQGVPITEYCDRHRVSVRERLELFLQACHGIQHAHLKGIIHRDIKPSNILVSVVDRRAVAKIIDFGIAKATNQRLTEKTLYTEIGRVVGTPAYMSPEQAEMSAESVDHRTDVYSLGVLLYELLVGELPHDWESFEKAAYHEVIRRIREDEPLTPSTRWNRLNQARVSELAMRRRVDPWTFTRQLRGDLDWVTMKALEKDRSRRYDTAGELAADIERHLRDEPVLARPPGVGYRVRKFVRKNRGPVTAVATVFLALAAGLVVSLLLYAETARQKREIDRNLYIAEMNVAQQAWENADVQRVLELLEGKRPRPGEDDLRGFEWFHLWRLCHGELFNLEGHTLRCTAVAFGGPSGKLLATASGDPYVSATGEIKLWDWSSGRELTGFSGEVSSVFSLAFSPDGTLLVTGGAAGLSKDTILLQNVTGEVKLWNVETRQLVRELSGHSEPVSSVAFDPRGRFLATGSWDTTAILWDAATFEQLHRLEHASPVWSLAFDADGRTLACGTSPTDPPVQTPARIVFWDVRTGEKSTTFASGETCVTSVAFSPGGDLVAAARSSPLDDVGEVELWRLEGGEKRVSGKTVLRGHHKGVTAVAFGPRGERLATAGHDYTVRVWDPETSQELRTLKGHAAPVLCVAFSGDGGTLVSGSGDSGDVARVREVKVWDLRDVPGSRTTLEGHTSGIGDLAFAPDRRRHLLASLDADTVILWDLDAGERRTISLAHSGNGIAFSHDGRTLAATCFDNREGPSWIKLYDASTGKEQRSFELKESAFMSPAFSPVDSVLAGARYDGLVMVWNLRTDARLTLAGHTHIIKCVVFSPDGGTIATGGTDNTIRLWDTETGDALAVLEEHNSDISSVAFSPDSSLLASASDDKTAKLWDLSTRRPYATLREHTGWVQSVAFSPDGRRVVTGSQDRTVKLWDVETGRLLASFEEHTAYVRCAAFSPDGSILASAGEDKVIRLRRAAPRQGD